MRTPKKRDNPGLQAVLDVAKKRGAECVEPMTALEFIAQACRCTVQAVCKWKHVPHVHVRTLEAVTGVSRYHQRPDVFGPQPQKPATKNRPRPKLRQPRSKVAA